MSKEIGLQQNGILFTLGLEHASSTSGVGGFFKRLSQKLVIPEGYQDEHGFHFGKPPKPQGPGPEQTNSPMLGRRHLPEQARTVDFWRAEKSLCCTTTRA